MDFNQVWTNYKELILVVATASITLIFSKILPWLWQYLVAKPWNILIKKINRRWGKRSFELDYLNWLIEENRHLKIRGLRMQTVISPEIEDIFIPLNSQASAQIASSQSYDTKKYDDEAVPVAQMLKENNRLVILGDPGSGKTTLLRYMAVCYARILRNKRAEGDNVKKIKDRLGFNKVSKSKSITRSLDKNFLPLLISLRSIQSNGYDLGNLDLSDVAFGRYLKSLEPKRYLNDQLEAGNCIIFLDGLDEVQSDSRSIVVEWIEDLVSSYPENHYVVTSRIVGYTVPLASGFKTFKLQDFADDDIRSFVHQWYMAVESDDNTKSLDKQTINDQADDLVDAILKNQQVRLLAINPLLLSIIALVHRYRAKLPEKRVDLYDECTLVLLGYWDQAKGIMGSLPPSQKRLILETIAYNMQLRKIQEIGEEDLILMLEQELPKVGATREDAAIFLSEIKERSGLLVERGAMIFSFSHLTFQEFLVARQIMRLGQSEMLIENISDDQWQEVLLLYCGLQDPTPILRILMTKPQDIFHTFTLLSGRCVAEAIATEEDVRKKVIENLVHLAINSKYKPLRDETVRVCKKIDLLFIIGKLRDNYQLNQQPVSNWAAASLVLIIEDLPDELCMALLDNEDTKLMTLRGLYRRKKISDKLFEQVVHLIDNENDDIRFSAARLVERNPKPGGLERLLKQIEVEQDHSVKMGLADAICEYTHHKIFWGVGQFLAIDSAWLQASYANSLRYAYSKLSVLNRLKFLPVIFGGLLIKLFRKPTRRQAFFIFCGLTCYLNSMFLLSPAILLDIRNKDEKHLIAKVVRWVYWQVFSMYGFFARSVFALGFPKKDAQFWADFFRSWIAYFIRDPNSGRLLYRYVNSDNKYYQEIISRNMIVANKDVILAKKLLENYLGKVSDMNQAGSGFLGLLYLIQECPEDAMRLIAKTLTSGQDLEKLIAIVASFRVKDKITEEQISQIRNLSTQSKSLDVRSAACQFLGMIKDNGAKECLVCSLSDSESQVRETAFYSLSEIRSPEFIDCIKPYLSVDDDETRDVAYDAVWEIAKQHHIFIES